MWLCFFDVYRRIAKEKGNVLSMNINISVLV